jgi:hypothetical protein
MTDDNRVYINCDYCNQELELLKPVTGDTMCDDCHAHRYCECGNALGEYEGEGFCPRCR